MRPSRGFARVTFSFQQSRLKKKKRDVDGQVVLWTSSVSEIPSACSFGECKFHGFEGSAEQKYHFFLHGTTQGRTSAGNETS